MFTSISKNKKQQQSQQVSQLIWDSAALTDTGAVREMNEDSILSRPEAGLWAVADGMGGHEAGEVASQMIIHALTNSDSPDQLSQFVETIDRDLIDVNRRIQQHSEMILQNRTLGSTVIVMLIRGNVGVCLWAGDSRLYCYRDGELIQMTRDHSRVEELVQQGLLLAEEANTHPEANVITRAVGAYIDLYLENSVFQVEAGDTYLLCSDGLYNSLSNEEIILQLQNNNSQSCVSGLIEQALVNEASDNVSAIVLCGATSSNE